MTDLYSGLLKVHHIIPGCDKEPYVKPTSPLKTGAWFWDVDEGTPDRDIHGKIPAYQFQWGNFDLKGPMSTGDVNTGKGGTKEAVFEDLVNKNAASLKKQVKMRVDAISDLNDSIFRKNSDGENVYFDLSYVYSEDLALVYSLKQFGYGTDEIAGQSVIYFDSENSADYVQGKIQQDGSTILTDDGKRIQLPETTDPAYKKIADNLHLKASFDFVGYYLGELASRGIGADFAVSFALEGADGPKALTWTEDSMRKAARYNVYAEKEGLTKYNYFNIDSEPSDKQKLQDYYLQINDEITGLFGPGTDFDFDIAAYVNQDQMVAAKGQQDPFAGLVAKDAKSMIFAGYRSTPKAQCEQFDALINPSMKGYARDSIWTMAWEGSADPAGVGRKAAPSPLIDLDSVVNMRKMADIAIAQAGFSEALSGNPMLINANPEVSISSFLPIYVQLVHDQV